MRGNLLRLDEDRVLVGQLRLLLGNVASALIPTLFLSIVLVLTLSNDSNALALKVWGVALMSYKLFAMLHARHYLASDIPVAQAHRLVWTLIVLNTIDGALWGALAWVTLDTSTVVGSILVISTIAGMVGSSMSRLTPVLPVFMAFVTTMLVLLATKVWTLGDPAYNSLGIVGIIFLTSVTLMARNSAKEIRASINLRFENVALLEKLQVKTEIAEAAQREAEHANTAKSKFLAAASHDLRQPIHAQGLFLEVLSRTEQTPYQQELLASARAASEASSELLNALLDFSRIEAGVIDPQLQPFRVQPLLNKIENELALQADAKNIVYRSRETHTAVLTDPVLLELILRNLISNAIRYTDQGGVLVACRQHGEHAALEIWDTGIGIAPEEQKEVFREFHQLGNPERDRRKGLGLGLAIADGLARAMGYELTLNSKPGRGSVFRLTLPLARNAPESNIMLHSKTRLLNARLLFIDDDEIVREGMLHLLRDWGCECEAAESIEEALALVQLNVPDVIVSDYRLREQRTGVEAIAALRKLIGRDIPALLITGDTAPTRLREAQASGIPLLHKPVSPGMLYRKLVELQQEVV
ncbi:MAG: response regulator [Gammaproteobacteria bacterium]|nr:response regulator [Gammaproteobacteria bacterium]MBU1480503.1 response regulator [Gammaproteobacteria bacterium]